jgi:arsenate reductase
MKFFKKEPENTILFVCVENAGRSQMAEGFFRKYAPSRYKGISAGTKPVSQINPPSCRSDERSWYRHQ